MNATDVYMTDLHFAITATGDLDRISGLANVSEALFRRLITTPGTLSHRPTYGVGIKDFQNALNTLGQQRKLALRIEEQFPLDPRVEKVLGVSISQDKTNTSLVKIIVRVSLVGFGEQAFSYTVGDLP